MKFDIHAEVRLSRIDIETCDACESDGYEGIPVTHKVEIAIWSDGFANCVHVHLCKSHAEQYEKDAKAALERDDHAGCSHVHGGET